ncbi:unnamed protein product [Rotaria sordida]|uniref:F-box domain-containing protein n=1 Tax=Rotaria sordida TaxID=392033 RepID=A0A814N3P4_9BILA|nr:unnamed protein product [Rotaria sordida]CAF3610958.1 unnamed protein product [Rotaria sordida]
MRNLINTFENLSREILLEIFDYLSINDCFNAFYDLNWEISSTLNLCGFSIDLTSISQQTYNEFYKKTIFSNYYYQIRKLKLSNDLTINLLENFFNYFHLDDFKQLRSLTLIKPSYMTLGSLALIIPYLKQLEHISIDSYSYPDNFFELVTSTSSSSSIKSCYLPGLEIQDELLFQSQIEYLTVTIEDIALLLNLLAVFPQLKYLNISLRSSLDIDENSLPKLNIISCKNLQILKFNILERSNIDFHEIKYFFQQISFDYLKSFSYNCTTNSLNHIDIISWNKILLNYLSKIEKFHFFLQIPFNSCTYMEVKQIFNNIQTNLSYTCPFSFSINHLYYIIHTNTYPKTHFDLSFKLFESDIYLNYDPINCDKTMKFSKVNSLTLDINLMSSFTILPKNIKYLQIQGQQNNLNLDKCLRQCSNQLVSLKIFGLPNDLPRMPKLRQLTIQNVMFNLNMISKLSFLCSHLELLTIEIDCIQQFGQILDQLRYKSNLTELKFIRAFSRDPNRTWTSWLNETEQLINNNNIIYETKSLFLFIWL